METTPRESHQKRAIIQAMLPIFPCEARLINANLAVQERSGIVYYFNGSMPIFSHNIGDLDSFRLITCQLIANNNCKQKEISECFEVSPISVKRWLKRYKSGNLSDFVSKKKVAKITDLPKK